MKELKFFLCIWLLFLGAIVCQEKERIPDEVYEEEEEQEFVWNPKDTFNMSVVVIDEEYTTFNQRITSREVIEEMGFGWNLGNTFDAFTDEVLNEGTKSEKAWGNPRASEDLVRAIKQKGFKAVRIPVTWHNHLIDDKYTIDPSWMTRVKTVVNWFIREGFYVILNTHHDNAWYVEERSIKYGSGYFPLKKDMKESEKFLYNVWRQIAIAFNSGYGHRLLFEGMNEPRMRGMEQEWYYDRDNKTCREAANALNEYNRLILKAIRESGGNNRGRFVLVTALSAGYDATINSPFVFPSDAKYNSFINPHIILSVHMYAPYDFTMKPDMNLTHFTEAYRRQLYSQFKSIYDKYIQYGHSVILGEMGAVNKNNTYARIAWGKYYIETARRFQMTPFLWDNGYWDNTETCDDIFGHLQRKTLTWENDKIIDAWIKSGLVELGTSDDVFTAEPRATFNMTGVILDNGKIFFDDRVTSRNIIEEMGFGWNLGNTFEAFSQDEVCDDGLESETLWGNPKTTEKMIDAIVKKGFKSIRIPVTWHNHIIDDRYTIDPEFMFRVKTVVVWCLKKGLFVILNTHHDNTSYKKRGSISYGSGYFPLKKDMEESERFLYNVWKQIALAFNNGFGPKLLFEGMNEPRMRGMEQEWFFDRENPTCLEAAAAVNEYNRIIHKAIRETGGNNAKRFILVSALAAGYDATVNSPFGFPNDTKYNNNPFYHKLILSTHLYTPYDFAMRPDMNISVFTDELRSLLHDQLKTLYYKFIKNGYSVIIGEMGAINKNNTVSRIVWGQYYIRQARRFQMTPFLWDNGNWDNSETCEDKFGHFLRRNLTWENDNIINAWIEAGQMALGLNSDIYVIEPEDFFRKKNLIVDNGKVDFDNTIPTSRIINEMGFGWNLGNSLDAFTKNVRNEGLDSETAWRNPRTTEKMIHSIINKGFKAIRIPVTWHNHIVDERYTIDPEWMERVKQVVDWCIEKGLYVILNTHNDNANFEVNRTISYGTGYYPLPKDMAESERFLYNIWRQISIAFNNGYDHHLLFEGMNEPRLVGLKQEWTYDQNSIECLQAVAAINEYNRLIVTTIRASGGNNAKRFILVTGLSAGYDAALSSNIIIPSDYENYYSRKIILSVHMYSPYDFTTNPDMDISFFSEPHKLELYSQIKNLYNKFVRKGYNVIITEMGAVNKNNTESRIAWGKYYIETARAFQITPFLWDNGKWDNTETCIDIYGHFQRRSLGWENDKIINAWIEAGKIAVRSKSDIFAIEPEDYFNGATMIIDSKEVKFDSTVTSRQVISEIGLGWTLGNSLDAFMNNAPGNEGTFSEILWNNPQTTQYMIEAVVRKGFKAIRIPVTWHNHIIDRVYTIDPAWMQRVKTVVGWCLQRGLYVIINTQNDNAPYSRSPIGYATGYYPLTKDMEESENFLYNIWRQIAIAFNEGYDHHLIFEGMNEPRLRGTQYEWYFDRTNPICQEAEDVLNEYNRLIFKAIRETGGNNEKRFILITGLSAGYNAALNSNIFFPNDNIYNPSNNKIILSIHMNTPEAFTISPNMNYTKFTTAYKNQMYTAFRSLYNRYIRLGYNIILGEMGAINKNNNIDRIYWGKYYIETARKFQMTPFLWDNGYWNNQFTSEDIFGHLIRTTLTWVNDGLINEWIKSGRVELGTNDDIFEIEPTMLFNSTSIVIDSGKSSFNSTYTIANIIEDMEFGWNLGNTFDAYNSDKQEDEGLDSEVSWGNPKTTKEMIQAIVDKGFKTIRIPVTWHNHLIDNRYTIDPEWMKRVKKVVDWCIKRGLFVIINSHHDNPKYVEAKSIAYGTGYYPLRKDMAESERFLYNIWKQIAFAFNDGYDQHLIFEGMNEPRLRGLKQEWSYDPNNYTCTEAASALNEYNRIIVKAIRETGGNNEKRFILITGLSAGYDAAINSRIVLPNDSKYNPTNKKLFLSVHMYIPFNFAFKPDVNIFEFNNNFQTELYDTLKALYNKYTLGGVDFIIGEMGAVNKNNTKQRIAWGKYYIETARKFQSTVLLWDNGKWDNTETCDDIFGHFQRRNLTWENDKIIDSWINSGKVPLGKVSDIFAIDTIATYDKDDMIVDSDEVKFSKKITAQDIIEEMGFGWNLGNTFDAYSSDDQEDEGLDSEKAWGNPKTTEKMINAIVKKGFKAIRIPVSWHNHLIDKKYTIDPEWMYRVKTVVDWCIDKGLYVIINSHHDNAWFESNGTISYGSGYFPLEKDMPESERFLYNIWKQIATAFNDGYDHHLLFETMNEPRLRGMRQEWSYDPKNIESEEAVSAINEYNRLVVRAIRETGGNNEKRFILVPCLSASYDTAIKSPFVMPNDKDYNPDNNKMILSVHMYSPFDFAFKPDMDLRAFNETFETELYDQLYALFDRFVKPGYNVIIGEMGAVNKNNTKQRIAWGKYYIETARLFQMTPFLWDNGRWDNTKTCEDIFGHFQRKELSWENDKIIDAWIESGNRPLGIIESTDKEEDKDDKDKKKKN